MCHYELVRTLMESQAETLGVRDFDFDGQTPLKTLLSLRLWVDRRRDIFVDVDVFFSLPSEGGPGVEYRKCLLSISECSLQGQMVEDFFIAATQGRQIVEAIVKEFK